MYGLNTVEELEARGFPKTYVTFKGKPKNGCDPRNYWIQDATEEFFDEIVKDITEKFPLEEPISKYKKGYTDEISTSEIREFQHEVLREKISLVCLTNDNNEVKLAGFNVLFITEKDEQDDFESKGWFLPFMIRVFELLEVKRNVYEEFGIDKCLRAIGLFVKPKFRGEGLAEQILRARMPLCKSIGIKVTSTFFTSALSQKAAYNAGYREFCAMDYLDLFKEQPALHIPGIEQHSKSIKVMIKHVDDPE